MVNDPRKEEIGYPPLPDDAYWIESMRSIVRQTKSSLDDAAKQLVTINTFAQTVYFAAISFTDSKKSLVQFRTIHILAIDLDRTGVIWVLLAPIISWIISLFFASLVFTPRSYRVNLNGATSSKEAFENMVKFKYITLNLAHLFLWVGFLFLAFNIFLYLRFFPASSTQCK